MSSSLDPARGVVSIILIPIFNEDVGCQVV